MFTHNSSIIIAFEIGFKRALFTFLKLLLLYSIFGCCCSFRVNTTKLHGWSRVSENQRLRVCPGSSFTFYGIFHVPFVVVVYSATCHVKFCANKVRAFPLVHCQLWLLGSQLQCKQLSILVRRIQVTVHSKFIRLLNANKLYRFFYFILQNTTVLKLRFSSKKGNTLQNLLPV